MIRLHLNIVAAPRGIDSSLSYFVKRSFFFGTAFVLRGASIFIFRAFEITVVAIHGSASDVHACVCVRAGRCLCLRVHMSAQCATTLRDTISVNTASALFWIVCIHGIDEQKIVRSTLVFRTTTFKCTDGCRDGLSFQFGKRNSKGSVIACSCYVRHCRSACVMRACKACQ